MSLVYVYTHIYIHIGIHMHMHIHIHIHIHMYVIVCLCMLMYTYVGRCVSACVQAHAIASLCLPVFAAMPVSMFYPSVFLSVIYLLYTYLTIHLSSVSLLLCLSTFACRQKHECMTVLSVVLVLVLVVRRTNSSESSTPSNGEHHGELVK